MLNDPSFEHRQPSWVRRSLRITNRVIPPTILSAGEEGGGRDQVDWGFRGTQELKMETEFISEKEEQERAKAPRVGRWTG